MLINETNNKEMNKSHQVIGSNVVTILKLDFVFSLVETIEIKSVYDMIGVNLVKLILLKLITQSATAISLS